MVGRKEAVVVAAVPAAATASILSTNIRMSNFRR